MPRRLLMAPWSWPCSEGLTLRDIMLWAGGPGDGHQVEKGDAEPEEEAGSGEAEE